MKIFRTVATLLAMLGILSGCGGESGAPTGSGIADTNTGNGSLAIGITDAEGDFLAYAVDVTSIKLTHADGRVVEALPQSTRVDFAQYVDLTEFVTAATVPNGRYIKASLVLDYTNADVQVEVNGAPVQAQVRDSEGHPITAREVEVTLEGDHPLVIAPGLMRHLTLDFDLQTSNSVDTSVTPPVVTVEPMLVADVEMKNPKPHRLRGLLQGVDQNQNLIQLQIRPFHRHDGDFGHFDAYVDDSTHYEIDGVAYTGNTGLAQLALQPLASWIVVMGKVDTATRHFMASEVYAGGSVPGSNQDAVTGVVTARNGDQLTVKARMIVRTDGSLLFNQDVTVVLDANTRVTRQLSRVSGAIGDISVGQHLDLLGTISVNGDVLTMDTTTQARLMRTFISGNTVGVNDGELVLNLQHLEGLPVSEFHFSGTGGSAADDADPATYQINTGTLSLGGIDINDPVRVIGFVTPFGAAPADFDAITVINVADVVATLVVQWPAPEATPFVSNSESGLVVDLDGSALHFVQRQWIRDDLNGAQPTIKSSVGGEGFFAIHTGQTVQLFNNFNDFETALSTQLASGKKMKRLVANGSFDNASTTLTAKGINVALTK